MSEERIRDALFLFGSAATQGKKPLKIELYKADQWKRSWRPHKKTMFPRPPLQSREYWQQYYRLRVDGRWYGINGFKYSFFTLEEAVKLAERLFITG